MTDDRQRLRREAVEWAEEAKGGRAGASGQYVTGTYPGILAMESLLVEARATIAEQAKEIERLNEEVAYLAHISGRG